MQRRDSVVMSTVAALIAAAGMSISARAAITLSPPNFLSLSAANSIPVANATTWSTAALAYTTGQAIDSNGRVYFFGQYKTVPAIGTLAVNTAIFTATNSTDLAVFNGINDGSTAPGTSLPLGNAALSVNGLAIVGNTSTSLRIAGSQVLVGVQVSGAGITESGTGQNNSYLLSGTYALGLSPTAQRYDGIPIAGVGTGNIITDFKALNNTSTSTTVPSDDMNAAGTVVSAVQFDPIGGFVAGTTLGSNDTALVTKTNAGAYAVIASKGAVAPGTGGAQFGSSASAITGNGVGGGTAKINGNGQVYFDVAYNSTAGNAGGVVNNVNDRALWVYDTATSTKTQLLRAGDLATGTGDGTSAYTGPVNIGSAHGVSNYGAIFNVHLTGGDASDTTSAFHPLANASGLYVATTSATTLVARKGDPAPGVANGYFGDFSSFSSLQINNSGRVVFGNTLESAFGGPTTSSPHGLWTGTPGNLQLVAKPGIPVPAGASGGATIGNILFNNPIAFNNVGTILFTANINGGNLFALNNFSSALYAWTPANGLQEILWGGFNAAGNQDGTQVEVTPGVFKNVGNGGWSYSGLDSGDGAAISLNDSNFAVLKLTFTDGTTGLVKIQVPAPGTGALAVIGLGLMARRRRRTI